MDATCPTVASLGAFKTHSLVAAGAPNNSMQRTALCAAADAER